MSSYSSLGLRSRDVVRKGHSKGKLCFSSSALAKFSGVNSVKEGSVIEGFSKQQRQRHKFKEHDPRSGGFLKKKNESKVDSSSRGTSLSGKEISTMSQSDLAFEIRISAKSDKADDVLWKKLTNRTIYLMSSLTPQYMSLIASGLSNAQIEDFLRIDVMQRIGDRAERTADAFEGKEMVALLHAFSKLNHQHKGMFQKMAERIRENGMRFQFTEQQLSRLSNTFCKYPDEKATMEAIGGLVVRLSASEPLSHPQSISFLANAFAKAQVCPSGLFDAISRGMTEDVLSALTSQNVSHLLYALGKLNLKEDQRGMLEKLVKLFPKLAAKSKMKSSEVAAAASAFFKLGEGDRRVWGVISKHFEDFKGDYSAEEAANILHALSMMGVPSSSSFRSVAPQVFSELLPSMDAHCTCIVISAYARAKEVPPPALLEDWMISVHMRSLHYLSSGLENRILKAVHEDDPHLLPQTLVNLLYALAGRLGLSSESSRARSAIVRELVEKVDELTAQHCANVLYALRRGLQSSEEEELFAKVIRRIPKLPNLEPRHMANTLSALEQLSSEKNMETLIPPSFASEFLEKFFTQQISCFTPQLLLSASKSCSFLDVQNVKFWNFLLERLHLFASDCSPIILVEFLSDLSSSEARRNPLVLEILKSASLRLSPEALAAMSAAQLTSLCNALGFLLVNCPEACEEAQRAFEKIGGECLRRCASLEMESVYSIAALIPQEYRVSTPPFDEMFLDAPSGPWVRPRSFRIENVPVLAPEEGEEEESLSFSAESFLYEEPTRSSFLQALSEKLVLSVGSAEGGEEDLLSKIEKIEKWTRAGADSALLGAWKNKCLEFYRKNEVNSENVEIFLKAAKILVEDYPSEIAKTISKFSKSDLKNVFSRNILDILRIMDSNPIFFLEEGRAARTRFLTQLAIKLKNESFSSGLLKTLLFSISLEDVRQPSFCPPLLCALSRSSLSDVISSAEAFLKCSSVALQAYPVLGENERNSGLMVVSELLQILEGMEAFESIPSAFLSVLSDTLKDKADLLDSPFSGELFSDFTSRILKKNKFSTNVFQEESGFSEASEYLYALGRLSRASGPPHLFQEILKGGETLAEQMSLLRLPSSPQFVSEALHGCAHLAVKFELPEVEGKSSILTLSQKLLESASAVLPGKLSERDSFLLWEAFNLLAQEYPLWVQESLTSAQRKKLNGVRPSFSGKRGAW